MWVGFILAAYSVVANDSVQTLGTWMVSNRDVPKQWLWAGASSVLVFALSYGWYVNNGDISYGRLNKIPFQEVQWYHALAPAILLLLTRFGVPVSTSFLVLSAFASTLVLEKMLMKSVMGYAVAAVAAYVIWYAISMAISKLPDLEKDELGRTKNHRQWQVAQWTTTGFLWWTWLSHDIANIAVFLPRQIDLSTLLIIAFVFVAFLGFMIRENGGKIQEIIVEKTSTKFVQSATAIDLIYFIILYIFKEVNDIPMSTTWVFVGLLAGREFAIGTFAGASKFKKVFPMVMKDFFKMMLGLAASVLIIMLIHRVL
jgi:hypothetical protein